MRQKSILLRLVEAVHFIHEQHGAPRQHGLRALHRLADVLHAAEHGRDLDELGVKTFGHQPRQRGLAHAGRAPEDHRVQLA